MSSLRKTRKTLIQVALGGVLLADLVLVGVNWHLATAPRPDQSELTLLKRQHDLLAADVKRGEQIRRDLPAVEKQCDDFFKDQLPPAGGAYSAVLDNLGQVAREAGLRAEDLTFHQHDADKHGVLLVEIGATVNGSYPSVERFINGLERSNSFYVLDELSLAAGSPGNLRLNLRLRTYFRS
jgi:hypothetical protein